MKKLFGFLFIIAFSFALVACTATDKDKDKEKDKEESITINYETNGGSTVASSKIDANNASSFTLPQNPTKEGFVFAGWYVDADLKTPFDALSVANNSVTLYAKWEEEGGGLRGNVSLSFSVKVDVAPLAGATDVTSSDEAHVDISGTATIAVALEEENVEELKDLKGSATITLNLKNDSNESFGDEADAIINQLTAAPIVLAAYVQNGFAYLTYGQVSYKVDLEKLVDFAKEQIEAAFEEYGDNYLAEGSELPTTPEEALSFLMEQVTYYIETYKVDMGLVGEILAKLLEFIPEAQVKDGKTIFAVTQADFNADIDSLTAFLKENEERIIKQIYDTVNAFFEAMFMPSPKDEYTDNEGNVLSLEKAGWTDATGASHSFSEDLEEGKFGYYDEVTETYCCYYLNAYWLTTTNPWQLVTYKEVEALKVGKTFADYNGNTYTYGTPSYVTADGQTVSLVENVEALEEAGIGSYDEDDNTFYVYATGDTFDLETGKIYDPSTSAIAGMKESFDEVLDTVPAAIKQSVKINEVKLELGEKDYSLKINVEFDNTPLQEMAEESVQAKLVISLTASYATGKVSITYPDFTNAVDVTDSILNANADGLE